MKRAVARSRSFCASHLDILSRLVGFKLCGLSWSCGFRFCGVDEGKVEKEVEEGNRLRWKALVVAVDFNVVLSKAMSLRSRSRTIHQNSEVRTSVQDWRSRVMLSVLRRTQVGERGTSPWLPCPHVYCFLAGKHWMGKGHDPQDIWLTTLDVVRTATFVATQDHQGSDENIDSIYLTSRYVNAAASVLSPETLVPCVCARGRKLWMQRP